MVADDRIAADGENAEHYAAPAPPPAGEVMVSEGELDTLSMAKLRVIDKGSGRN